MSPHSLPSVEGGLVGKVRAKTDTVVANTARFAEAWLDETHRSFYYYMNPGEFFFTSVSRHKSIVHFPPMRTKSQKKKLKRTIIMRCAKKAPPLNVM